MEFIKKFEQFISDSAKHLVIDAESILADVKKDEADTIEKIDEFAAELKTKGNADVDAIIAEAKAKVLVLQSDATKFLNAKAMLSTTLKTILPTLKIEANEALLKGITDLQTLIDGELDKAKSSL